MYFENSYESDTHMNAKVKLFNLIVSRRVKIKDSDGVYYDIFKSQHENEFLHIESPVMDYNDDVLFSNEDTPCKKHFDKYINNPFCDMKGYHGAFDKLPCMDCLESNFGHMMDGSTKYASYRPDISYGYNNKHKIWLEVKYKNECSLDKVRFCNNYDIALLEINAEDIENFEDYNGKLKFNRLKLSDYDIDASEIDNIILKEIKENGCILVSSAKSMLHDKFSGAKYRCAYDVLLKNNQLIEMTINNQGLKDLLGIQGSKKVLLSIDEYENNYKHIELNYDKNIHDDIFNVAIEVKNNNMENGFIFLSDFKEKLENVAPKGYKSKIKYNEIFVKLDLVSLIMDDYYEDLVKLGAFSKSVFKKVVITRELFDKLNKNI